ncbi:peptidyl-prolyl cis-trans isomerase [Paenibacillus ferrarius]|uniref:peptidylprolyl isomerase n=1 Tax=Paenibacillus ferrarius TaxID=1469647 RepID=UPI003D2E6727
MPNRKLWKKRRGLAWGCVIVMATLVLSGCMKLQAQGNADSAGVAFVNGQLVEAREFAAVLQGERSKTYAYFQDKYGAEDSPTFWKMNYQGEVPLAKIEKDVLQKMVRTKVQQVLAIQHGLLQDASYTAFLRELTQENERRQKEVNSGRPVYGPKQLTEKAYYDMRQSELLDDLKQQMSTGTVISDSDIQAYYDKNKKEFVQSGTTNVRLISIPFSTVDGGASKKEAQSSMQAILKRLEGGETFTAVTGAYCSSQPAKVACKEQQFSAATARQDVLASPKLTTAAKSLKKGEVSAVIDEQQALTLLYGWDQQADTLMPLEEVKSTIVAKLKDQAFERLLQDEINRAQLTLDEEVLRSVEANVLMGK